MVYTFVKGKKANQQNLVLNGVTIEEGILFLPSKGIDQRAVKAIRNGFVKGEDEFEGENEELFLSNYDYACTLLTNFHGLKDKYPHSYSEVAGAIGNRGKY
jgi:hypothetical protein